MLLFFCIWLIAFLLQIYYGFLPSFRPKEPTGAQPDMSVVVCVHRDAAKLHRLLVSLFDQTYRNYEVVVVNDGPDPEIDHCLTQFSQHPNLRVVNFDASTKTIPGKKAPLTAGIQAAQYDWLLLTDGDCVPKREWIKAISVQLQGETKMILGYAPFFETKGILNLLQRFDNVVIAIQYLGSALRGNPYMGVGRNLLYHRGLFNAADGFQKHVHISSGDDDLFVQEVSNRMNTQACLEPHAFVFSEAPVSWEEWMHQKRRHLSASYSYRRNVQMRSALFAMSWLMTWLGIPVLLSHALVWYVIGLAAVVVLWALFARAAFALRQQQLIGWYPVAAFLYCFLLCTFAVLSAKRTPISWTRS